VAAPGAGVKRRPIGDPPVQDTPWTPLDEVTTAAKAFLDLVLAGDVDATWNPDTWA